VFNPERLVKQIELPNKKGDPVKQLKNDPGFKIFRLDDVNKGIQASYHTIDYKIAGYESLEQLVVLTEKFVIGITNMFPKDNKDNIFETYDKFVTDRVNELNSLLQGTEEYLTTLMRKGESSRVEEVLNAQTRDIRKFVAETFIKIENIKEFTNYLEYKERESIVPKIKEILSKWDETVENLGVKLAEIANKF
jgi:hypothetical protein